MTSSVPRPVGFIGWTVVVWGVMGVFGLLLNAVIRLVPIVVASFEQAQMMHVPAYIASVAFLAYSEGYKAFQLQFSPRVVVRSMHAGASPTWARAVLAPLFSMGFFGATKKRKIVAWSITTGVILLIVLVHQLNQPWRGIVDAGVVVGLSWGLVSMLVFFIQTLRGSPPGIEPDLA